MQKLSKYYNSSNLLQWRLGKLSRRRIVAESMAFGLNNFQNIEISYKLFKIRLEQKPEDKEILWGQIMGLTHMYRIYLDNVLKHEMFIRNPKIFSNVRG